jgi:serine/threonine protein kinase
VIHEIRILKELSRHHPNISTLLEVIDDQFSIYLVLEYEKGGELFEHVVKKKRLSERRARSYFRQIVSAVGFCHRHGVVHRLEALSADSSYPLINIYRDLKTENILLDGKGRVKIIDFGLSSIVTSPEDFSRTFCGSAAYAAPGIPFFYIFFFSLLLLQY